MAYHAKPTRAFTTLRNTLFEDRPKIIYETAKIRALKQNYPVVSLPQDGSPWCLPLRIEHCSNARTSKLLNLRNITIL